MNGKKRQMGDGTGPTRLERLRRALPGHIQPDIEYVMDPVQGLCEILRGAEGGETHRFVVKHSNFTEHEAAALKKCGLLNIG